MGWPTTDTFDISYSRKALAPIAQGFHGGLIEASTASGARILLPGPISSKFFANKGHCGAAGLPTSDPYEWPGAEATWRCRPWSSGTSPSTSRRARRYICTYEGACSWDC